MVAMGAGPAQQASNTNVSREGGIRRVGELVVSISRIAYETYEVSSNFREHAIKLKFRQHFKNEVRSSIKKILFGMSTLAKIQL
jgi:hypothetical protein